MTRMKQQHGVTLVEVLVSLGLGMVGLFFLFTVLGRGFQAQRSTELRGDAVMLRHLLSTAVDCNATLAAAGIDPRAPGAACTSTSAPSGQAGPFLRLRRRTVSGATAWIGASTLNPDGSFDVGEWRVRATCSAAEQTLVVRAVPVQADGTPKVDPLTKAPYDWGSAKALMFGRTTPLCYASGPRCIAVSSGVPVDNPPLGTTVAAACPTGFKGGNCMLDTVMWAYPPAGGSVPYESFRPAAWNAAMTQCSHTTTSGPGLYRRIQLNAVCCTRN